MHVSLERLDLRCSRSKIPDLTESIKGLQITGPTKKHQKEIPAKLVLHIYNIKHSHMSMAILQIAAVIFFFGMRSCEESMILRKGDIIFYRKLRELTQNIGCIHISEKLSPTSRA